MTEPTFGSPTEKAVQATKADAAKSDDKNKESLPSLGLPESEGHKGAISIDGDVPIESVLLAYQAVQAIADEIAKRVIDLKKKDRALEVLIHNPADFHAIEALRAFDVRAGLIAGSLKSLAQEAKKLLQQADEHELVDPLTAAGVVITAGLQLLSLFRVDHKLKNFKIEIEDQTLATAVAGALKAGGATVYNTAIVPFPPKDPPESAFLRQRLGELIKLRATLVELGDKLVDKEKDQKPDAIDPAKKSMHDRIVAAIAGLDTFDDSLVKVDEKTGVSPLSQLSAAESALSMLKQDTLILWLKAVAAGGGSHSKEGTFTSDLTYSGGAIANYSIYSQTGELLKADIVPMYAGYVRMHELEEGELKKFALKSD